MKVVLGLDVGEVRVGVAILDMAVGIPLPLTYFPRADGEAERKILQLIQVRGVDVLAVGLPLNDDGTESGQCDDVRKFVRRIERRCILSVTFIDEYGSSEEAYERLITKGAGRVDKGEIDTLSALIVLERYLGLISESSEE